MNRKDITYIIPVSNGVIEKKYFMQHDGEWVYDRDSAIKMVETKINKAWKVVK